jgi:hypothetical protein
VKIFYGAFDGISPDDLNKLTELSADGSAVIVGLLTNEYLTENNQRPHYDYQQREALLRALPQVVDVLAADRIPDTTRLNDYETVVVPEEWLPVLTEGQNISAIEENHRGLDSRLWAVRRLLLNRMFVFGAEGAPQYTDKFVLEQDGFVSAGEDLVGRPRWRFSENRLFIEDEAANLLVHFDLTESLIDDYGMLTLTGTDDVVGSSQRYFLRELSLIERQRNLIQAELAKTGATSERLSLLADRLEQYDLQLPAKALSKARRIRILFLLNDVENIASLLRLMKIMTQDELFEVKIFTVNKRWQGQTIVGSRALLDERLFNEGLTAVKSAGSMAVDIARLRDWSPDYTFKQSLADDDFPGEFATRKMSWTKLVHVPAEITDGFFADFNPYTANAVYEQLWRAFVPLPLTEEESALLDEYFVSSDVMQAIGSSKAVEIVNTTPDWPNLIPGKRVLWIAEPDVGTAGHQTGTFDVNYQKMLQFVRDHRGLNVIFAPKLGLKEAISAGYGNVSPAEYESFISDWYGLPNTAVLQGENLYAAMAAADIIVADGGVTLFDAQLLGKPVIYLECQPEMNLSHLGQRWLSGVHRVADWVTFSETFNNLLTDVDTLELVQRDNASAVLINQHPEVAIMNELELDYAITREHFG